VRMLNWLGLVQRLVARVSTGLSHKSAY